MTKHDFESADGMRQWAIEHQAVWDAERKSCHVRMDHHEQRIAEVEHAVSDHLLECSARAAHTEETMRTLVDKVERVADTSRRLDLKTARWSGQSMIIGLAIVCAMNLITIGLAAASVYAAFTR